MLLRTAPDGTQLAARERRIPRRAAICLLICFCLVWFYTLGGRTLVPTDEGRYAEIAREMAATGDFLTPHLNGIKYFGKPPLQAWTTALAFSVFGLGEWQARLWTGLCGLAGIFMVFLAGGRLYNAATGITAALVLGSSFFWAAAAHVSSYDMGLSAMLTCALCALLIAQRPAASPREQRNWMFGCWAGMALAVLSKGLVGIVLPGVVLVLYTLVSRDWRIWGRLHIVPGLALFLAIAAPWFVLVSLENPEFPAFFFIREHVGRFTSDVHSRQEPWHYFLPFLVVGMTPWFGVLAQSLRHGGRATAAGFDPGRFLVVWAGSIFVFFSLSHAKLPAYILPVFPALALLIARHLESATHKAIIVAAAPLALLGAAVLVFQWIGPALIKNMHELTPAQRGYMHWITGAAALLLLGGIAAAWLARRARAWALTVLAAAGFLAGQALMLGHEPLGRDKAGVAHLAAVRSEITPQTPIYAVGQYEYALPFYLGRTLIMVYKAEDAMRLDLERRPHLWIPRLDTFIATWEAQRARGMKAIAFIRPDIYADLRRRGVPMRVIGKDARRVIATNDVPVVLYK
jgi:4-amino-4-deoxy-L-arabinose transferase-like glycosyltransferase